MSLTRRKLLRNSLLGAGAIATGKVVADNLLEKPTLTIKPIEITSDGANWFVENDAAKWSTRDVQGLIIRLQMAVKGGE